MSTAVMLTVKHQVLRRQLRVAPRRGHQLVRKPRIPHRLLSRIERGRRRFLLVRLGRGAEVGAVGVDAAGESVGQPVEGYGLEDGVEGGVLVGPFEEFFADPGEHGEGGGGEDEADGGGAGAVFAGVG